MQNSLDYFTEKIADKGTPKLKRFLDRRGKPFVPYGYNRYRFDIIDTADPVYKVRPFYIKSYLVNAFYNSDNDPLGIFRNGVYIPATEDIDQSAIIRLIQYFTPINYSSKLVEGTTGITYHEFDEDILTHLKILESEARHYNNMVVGLLPRARRDKIDALRHYRRVLRFVSMASPSDGNALKPVVNILKTMINSFTTS